MADDLTVIADRLYNNQQTIVSLTEQDYDATPVVVTMQQELKVAINLKIEKDDATGTDVLIWNNTTNGKWDLFKWGPRTPSYTTVEELINI